MERRDAGDRSGPVTPTPAPTPDLVAPPPPTPTQLRDVNLHRVETDLGARTSTQRLDDNLNALDLLLKLRDEGRRATPEEQSVLLKYAGWGDSAYEYLFDARSVTGKDFQRREQFNNLLSRLSEAERQALVKSRKTAFYTTPSLIKAIWSGLRTIGLDSLNRVRVLEPSAGVGNFLGFEPTALATKSARTAVELDSVTGDILRNLYQNADVQVKGFQEALLPDNHFDVAVSNVPFGDEGIVDPTPGYMGENNRWKTRAIHTYFMVKALDKIRPGGVEAFIVSHGAMDAQAHTVLRQAISRRAELLGAFRLPRDIFPDTSVTTDIIFLRKYKVGETPKPAPWAETVPVQVTSYGSKPVEGVAGTNARVNRYFLDNPNNVLGEHVIGSGLYGRAEYQVRKFPAATTDAILASLREAIGTLPKGVIEPERDPVTPSLYPPNVVNSVKEGAFILQEGKLLVRRGGALVPTDLGTDAQAKVRQMLVIRDAARHVLQLQLEGASDAELKAAQKTLTEAHATFVSRYKALNYPTNRRLLADDPDGPFLLSLEKWDPKKAAALKEKYPKPEDGYHESADRAALRAPIFTDRVIRAGQKVEKVDNAQDALLVSLRDRNGVDLDHMQGLTGLDPQALIRDLGDRVYRNPTGGWEASERYLSGNVRQKLAEAQQAVASDPSFERNVAALKAVIPENVPYSQMDVRLGAQWLPVDVINRFLHEHLGYAAPGVPDYVKWNNGAAEWQLLTDKLGPQTAEAQSKIYSPDFTSAEIIRYALNGEEPVVRTPEPDPPHTPRLDPVRTQAARDKVFGVRQAFKDWLWTDPERLDRLTTMYNERYNYYREPKWDGSHLDLAGSNPRVKLMPHQKAAIWRILQEGNTLLAHEVGFGKSKIMIGAGMEARRLGLARKNLYVVPNHLVEQFRREFYDLYPNANILVPDTTEGAEVRQTFAARIATGDWDAVILPESQMTLLPVRPETRQAFLTEQIKQMQAYQREALAVEKKTKDTSARRTSKRMQGEIDKMVEQLQRVSAELKSRQDTTMYWEDLGVDQLFVDESDRFKNLYFPSRMQSMKGFPRATNQKSDDIFLKTQDVAARNGGRGVVFATGTPVSNSIAELWTVMRYLMGPKLTDLGLGHFDAWRSQFADIGVRMERTVAGDYKATSRFSEFRNAPELIKLFHHVADVRMSEDNPDLAAMKPRLANGKRTVVDVEASDQQREYQKSLAKRAEDVKKHSNDKSRDNMLKITDDAKKASLDLRLVLKGASEFPEGKIPRLVQEVSRIYKEETPRKGTQVVFLDMGTPKTMSELKAKYRAKATKMAERLKIPLDEALSRTMEGTQDLEEQLQIQNVYKQIKEKLVAAGVPEKEISFIHEAKSDDAKKALFDRINEGDTRVVIGSTEKLGAGANFQRRLAALHHLDSPWRPRDIEQREGRILRQNNDMYGPGIERDSTTGEVKVVEPGRGVHIFQYVTKDSFDAYIWQAIERKQYAIKTAIRGNSSARALPDADEMVLSAGEIQAKVSGDPLIFDRMEAIAAAETIERQRLAHQDEILRATWQRDGNQRDLISAQADLARIQADANRINQTPSEFALTVDPSFSGQGPVTFTDRAKANELLQARVADALKDAPLSHDSLSVVPVGSYRGMRVSLLVSKEVVRNTISESGSFIWSGPAVRILPVLDRNKVFPEGMYLSSASSWFSVDDLGKADLATRIGNLGMVLKNQAGKVTESIAEKQQKIAAAEYTLANQRFTGTARLESLRNGIATIEAHLERTTPLSPDAATALRTQLQRLYKGEDVAIAPPTREAKGLGANDDGVVADETAGEEATSDEGGATGEAATGGGTQRDSLERLRAGLEQQSREATLPTGPTVAAQAETIAKALQRGIRAEATSPSRPEFGLGSIGSYSASLRAQAAEARPVISEKAQVAIQRATASLYKPQFGVGYIEGQGQGTLGLDELRALITPDNFGESPLSRDYDQKLIDARDEANISALSKNRTASEQRRYDQLVKDNKAEYEAELADHKQMIRQMATQGATPLFAGLHPQIVRQALQLAKDYPQQTAIAALGTLTVAAVVRRLQGEAQGQTQPEMTQSPILNKILDSGLGDYISLAQPGVAYGLTQVLPGWREAENEPFRLRDVPEGMSAWAENVVDPAAELAFEVVDLAPAGIAKALGVQRAREGFFDITNPLAFAGDFLTADNSLSTVYEGLKKRAQERQAAAPLPYALFTLPFDPLNYFGWGAGKQSVEAIDAALAPAEYVVGHGLTDLSAASRASLIAQDMGTTFRGLAGTGQLDASAVVEDIAAKMGKGTASQDEMKLANALGTRTPVDRAAVLDLAEKMGVKDLPDPPQQLIEAISNRVQGLHEFSADDIAWLRDQFDAIGPTAAGQEEQLQRWFAKNQGKVTVEAMQGLRDILRPVGTTLQVDPTHVGLVARRMLNKSSFTPDDIAYLKRVFGVWPSRALAQLPKTPLNEWAIRHGLPDLAPAIKRAQGLTAEQFQGYVIWATRKQVPVETSKWATWLEQYPMARSVLNAWETALPAREIAGQIGKSVVLPFQLSFLTTPSWPIHVGETLMLNAFHPSMLADAARATYKIGKGVLNRQSFRQVAAQLDMFHDQDATRDLFANWYPQIFLEGRGGLSNVPARANAMTEGIIPFIGGRPSAAVADLIRGARPDKGAPVGLWREKFAQGVQGFHLGSLFGLFQNAVQSMHRSATFAFVARTHPEMYRQVLDHLGAEAQQAQKVVDAAIVRPKGLSDELWRRLKPMGQLAGHQGRLAQLVEPILRGAIDRHALALQAYLEGDIPLSAQSEIWAILAHSTPEEMKAVFAPSGSAIPSTTPPEVAQFWGAAEKIVNDALDLEHGDRLGSLVQDVLKRATIETAAGRRAAWQEIHDALGAGHEIHRKLWDYVWSLSNGLPQSDKDALFANVRTIRANLLAAQRQEETRARTLFWQGTLRQRNIPVPRKVMQGFEAIWDARQKAFADQDQRWTDYWAKVRRKMPASINEVRDANDKTWYEYRTERNDTEEKVWAQLENFYQRRKAGDVTEPVVNLPAEVGRVVPPDVRTAALSALQRLRLQAGEFIARPTIDAPQSDVVRQWAQQVDDAVAKLPPGVADKVEQAHQAAARLTMDAADARFVDYTHRTNVEEFVQKFVPYWMYDFHGGAYWSWLLTHVPGAAVQLNEYLKQTQGSGYYPTTGAPGVADIGPEINPMRGLWPERWVSLANTMGRYHPTTVQQALKDGFNGIFTQTFAGLSPALTVPEGLIAGGKTVTSMGWPPIANAIDDTIAALGGGLARDDPFTQYRTALQEAAEGAAPLDATVPEERQAQRAVGLQDLPQLLLPRFRNPTPQQLAERRDYQTELANHGISRAEQAQLSVQGISPWSSGHLSKEDQKDILSRHPDWPGLWQASDVFLPPEQRQLAKKTSDYFKSLNDIQTYRHEAQVKLDNGLASNDLSPSAWISAHSKLAANVQGRYTEAGILSPDAVTNLQEAQAKRLLSANDAAHQIYIQKEQDLIKKDADPTTGLPDWTSIYTELDAYMASLPPDQQQYIQTQSEKNMTPTEKEFRAAAKNYDQYRQLPRATNFSPDEWAKRLVQEKNFAALQRTDPKAALVQYSLGTYDLLRRRIKPNPARLQFLQQHPDVVKWFVTMSDAQLRKYLAGQTTLDSYSTLGEPTSVPWSLTPQQTTPGVAAPPQPPPQAPWWGGQPQSPQPVAPQ